MRASAEGAIRSLGSPLYGLAGEWSRTYAGSGEGGGAIHVSLRHHRPGELVEVETESGDARAIDEDATALTRWFLLRTGSRAATAELFPLRLEVDRWTTDISVEGSPTALTVIGDDTCASAYGKAGDRTVRLYSRGAALESLTVVPLTVEDVLEHYQH